MGSGAGVAKQSLLPHNGIVSPAPLRRPYAAALESLHMQALLMYSIHIEPAFCPIGQGGLQKVNLYDQDLYPQRGGQDPQSSKVFCEVVVSDVRWRKSRAAVGTC